MIRWIVRYGQGRRRVVTRHYSEWREVDGGREFNLMLPLYFKTKEEAEPVVNALVTTHRHDRASIKVLARQVTPRHKQLLGITDATPLSVVAWEMGGCVACGALDRDGNTWAHTDCWDRLCQLHRSRDMHGQVSQISRIQRGG